MGISQQKSGLVCALSHIFKRMYLQKAMHVFQMIELLKEQIYRGSIISVTKQRVDHSIDQLDNKDNIHQQVPVAEQYGGELIPQMVLLQKQLESQQLLMARALSTQMEEVRLGADRGFFKWRSFLHYIKHCH